jgi:hypothetical protein
VKASRGVAVDSCRTSLILEIQVGADDRAPDRDAVQDGLEDRDLDLVVCRKPDHRDGVIAFSPVVVTA